jgi:hypothetical protein
LKYREAEKTLSGIAREDLSHICRSQEQSKDDKLGQNEERKLLTVTTAAARSPRKSSTTSTCCRVMHMCTLP